MVKILLTGGAGFIGSHLAEELVKRDYYVYVLDKLTYAGNLENIKELLKNKNFCFIRGDINNKKLVKQLFKKVDKIIHLAAETHIDRSLLDPDIFVKTDFFGTYNLLETLKKYPCERFIHISTSEVYGTALKVPIDENHPLNPQSPYAATKVGADRLCYAYYLTYHLPIIILRPFNIYGEKQYPEKLIPFFITQALENKPLFIYGDGENTRDYLYVKDLCEVIIKFLEAPIEKYLGEVFNIGSGFEYSVNEISLRILEYFKKPKSLLKYISDRKGHVKRLICDYTKLQKEFNWQPKTTFEEGLEKTMKWYLENERWWKKIKKSKLFQRFYYLNYLKRK
ncbi:MAG: dTDP-glucose 4,6-dehydratase [candidate division WOR-3 bacterium]|uniref:dTDP-glucose 4,6-dehydratase n=1 Tax=candidate division WOR-3 bacterium TaxID=2052148 RepID=A0A7C4VZ49_UNCW3